MLWNGQVIASIILCVCVCVCVCVWGGGGGGGVKACMNHYIPQFYMDVISPPDPNLDAGLANLSLQWRHNERDSVSNHQPHDCLLNRLFRRRSKKTSKLRVTGLCAGNSPRTGEFPTQMASYAENVSIWWHHHVITQETLAQDIVREIAKHLIH